MVTRGAPARRGHPRQARTAIQVRDQSSGRSASHRSHSSAKFHYHRRGEISRNAVNATAAAPRPRAGDEPASGMGSSTGARAWWIPPFPMSGARLSSRRSAVSCSTAYRPIGHPRIVAARSPSLTRQVPAQPPRSAASPIAGHSTGFVRFTPETRRASSAGRSGARNPFLESRSGMIIDLGHLDQCSIRNPLFGHSGVLSDLVAGSPGRFPIKVRIKRRTE